MRTIHLRVEGHYLVAGGAPFTSSGSRTHRARYWMGTAGPGRGKCSCGLLSAVLDGPEDRRRWHREHKDEVRSRS